ncbi:POK9 protein, partial [Oreotrochilus melanogaster]|nr:POK9 protein [Oreotrochilus melanogaster]
NGSLGLDLATAIDVTFVDNKPQKIPTGITSPVKYGGKPCGALVLGRSSAGLKGLFVLPGLIDSDYTGEICIVAMTWTLPMMIPKGSRIAQLVLTQQLTDAAAASSTFAHGAAGFGFTGEVALLCLPMDQRPKAPILLERQQDQCRLTALLDTGADITIV